MHGTLQTDPAVVGDHLFNDYESADIERKRNEAQNKGYVKGCLIFQALIYLIAIFAFSTGKPQQLGQPFDSANQPCGVGIGMEDYKYIYFTTPLEGYLWRTLCVKECPVLHADMNEADESLQLDCYPNVLISTCQNRPSVGNPEYSTYYYSSVANGNICLPLNQKYFETVMTATQQSAMITLLTDITKSKYVILFSISLAVVLKQIYSLLSLLLLRFLPKHPVFMVWAVTIGSIVTTCFQCITCLILYFNATSAQKIPDKDLTKDTAISMAHAQLTSSNSLLYTAIGWGVLALILLVQIVFKMNWITNLANKFGKLNLFLSEIYTGIIQICVAGSVLLVIFLVIWFQMAMYIFSIGSTSATPKQLPFQQFRESWLVMILAPLHFADLILMSLFLIAAPTFVMKSYVIAHFRKFVKPSRPETDAVDAFKQFLQFNIGSVVQGEILIKYGQILKFFLYPYKFYKNWRGQLLEEGSLLYNAESYTDDSYIYAALRNDTFTQASRMSYQYNADLRQKGYSLGGGGPVFIAEVAFCIPNTLMALTQIIIATSSLNQELSNPANVQMILYIFTMLISILFASVNGRSLETLIALMQRHLNPNGKEFGIKEPHELKELIENNGHFLGSH